MLSLFLRNLLFTILQPGIVTGLIPFWILGSMAKSNFTNPWNIHHHLGAILFVTGLVTMLACILSFATKGKGTLSPVDPTKRLVISGLYNYSRNPMYVGVMMILIGECIFFQSISLSVYSAIIFIAFNLFVILREEPRLRKDFGNEYIQYSRQVRRWM